MTPRGRTNQLLYQAEALLATPEGDDEHAPARRLALQEGALALFELALNSLLREVTEHARLPRHDWRLLLGAEGPALAELERLRDLARQESWLGWLIVQLERLHGVDGASERRAPAREQFIAVSAPASLEQTLLEQLEAAKSDIAALRETSFEW